MPTKFLFQTGQTAEIATVDVQQLHFVWLRSPGTPAQYLQVVPKHEKNALFFTLFGRVITLLGGQLRRFKNVFFRWFFVNHDLGVFLSINLVDCVPQNDCGAPLDLRP